MVYRLRQPAPGPSLCPENVERALVVAADGAVTPCVFRSLDLPGAEEWNDAGPRPLTRLVFGNIREQTLPVIWKAPRSRQFRQAWRKPGPPAECRGCRRIASPLSDPD
jgi:MoaA/NifB/PqqE/SkfB family radical SAM enzyme